MSQSVRTALLLCVSALSATWVHAGNEMSDALKRKPDRRHGETLYDHCAVCHRADGSGDAKKGVPNIAGQHYQAILKQLVDFRDTERLDLRMEASASKHHLRGAQDLADVAAYIARMPLQGTTDTGPNKHSYAGKLAYDRACAHCHGAAGEGNADRRYPRLAGQHYTYLLKQIDSMIGGSRFNAGWDHSQLMTGLTDDEMVGVAEYLARLSPSTAKTSNP